MREKKSGIDYLDLYLELSESQLAPIEYALEQFEDHYIHTQVAPRLKNGMLLINSSDLVPFLGYVNPESFNEMDRFRFRNEIKKKLEAQLSKSLSLDNQSHYKWCLAAANSKEMGRFL